MMYRKFLLGYWLGWWIFLSCSEVKIQICHSFVIPQSSKTWKQQEQQQQQQQQQQRFGLDMTTVLRTTQRTNQEKQKPPFPKISSRTISQCLFMTSSTSSTYEPITSFRNDTSSAMNITNTCDTNEYDSMNLNLQMDFDNKEQSNNMIAVSDSSVLIGSSSSSKRSKRTECEPVQTIPIPRPKSNIAVILNKNARGVTKKIVDVAYATFDPSQIHVTNSVEEAKFVANCLATQLLEEIQSIEKKKLSSNNIDTATTAIRIMRQNETDMVKSQSSTSSSSSKLSLIIPVGGDGTLTSMIDYISHELMRQSKGSISTREDALSYLPMFGYIPLGTGNGVGSVVGCKTPLEDQVSSNRNQQSTNEVMEENVTKRRKESPATILASNQDDTHHRRRRPLSRIGQIARSTIPQSVQNVVGRYRPRFRRQKKEFDDRNVDQQQERDVQTKSVFTKNQSQLQLVMEQLKQIGEALSDGTGHSKHGTNNVTLNYDRVDLPMMELTSTTTTTTTTTLSDLCFFAGVGFDSLMLQDFKDLKKWSAERAKQKKLFSNPLYKMLSSVTGYCVALVTMTLPKCVTKQAHLVDVEIASPVVSNDKSTKNQVYWVDHRRGDVLQEVLTTDVGRDTISSRTIVNNINETEESSSSNSTISNNQNANILLYRGTAGIVAGGTVPFYGGGLRLFPFARMTPPSADSQLWNMHLRIGRIHPMIGFLNIPRIFEGSYRDKSRSKFGCLDFVGNCFDITVRGRKGATSSKVSSALSSSSSTEISETTATGSDETSTVDFVSTPETSCRGSIGYPLQHSGESIGMVEHFRLQVISKPIRFVTLLPPRLEIDEP